MMSGVSATNSRIFASILVSVLVHRVSICIFRPVTQPDCADLQERPDPGLNFRIVRGCRQEHADAPHALALLRAHRDWPGHRRAADQRDELVVSYSITSSARALSKYGH